MDFYRIHPKDQVVIALRPLKAGEYIDGVKVKEPIPAGHKLAVSHVPAGHPIIKYGCPIGTAIQDINAGDWVHTHNMRTALKGTQDYYYEPVKFEPVEPLHGDFGGYVRNDGSVGIRNEIWIIPTVGCVNAIASEVARCAQQQAHPGVGKIVALTHPYGCSQLGDDHFMTQDALCGLIRHPNAGGVLVLGLGCENNHVDSLKKRLGSYDPERVRFLICQDCCDEVGEALKQVEELIRYASAFKRKRCGLENLVVGLKCGGSDGYSGITSNPLLGRFTDRLTAAGGTAILTEVPEMFGAEQWLMNRCKDSAVFDKTVRLVNDFKEYFLFHGQPVGENPSPGNKKGGITTLEEKSLGCVQKSGMAPVVDVLPYGGKLCRKGLNLLQAPGNDLVASAALAISGAQIILFTTGRGTPFGCPVPTMKISSNTDLARKKPSWLDFDAGRLLRDDRERVEKEFFHLILEIVGGREVYSENQDNGNLAIFKNGVTL